MSKVKVANPTAQYPSKKTTVHLLIIDYVFLNSFLQYLLFLFFNSRLVHHFAALLGCLTSSHHFTNSLSSATLGPRHLPFDTNLKKKQFMRLSYCRAKDDRSVHISQHHIFPGLIAIYLRFKTSRKMSVKNFQSDEQSTINPNVTSWR